MTVGLRAVSRVKMTILRQAQRHFLPLQKPPGISLKAHAGDVPQTLLSAAPRLRPFEVTGILDPPRNQNEPPLRKNKFSRR